VGTSSADDDVPYGQRVWEGIGAVPPLDRRQVGLVAWSQPQSAIPPDLEDERRLTEDYVRRETEARVIDRAAKANAVNAQAPALSVADLAGSIDRI
jgi:hypothetical protein